MELTTIIDILFLTNALSLGVIVSMSTRSRRQAKLITKLEKDVQSGKDLIQTYFNTVSECEEELTKTKQKLVYANVDIEAGKEIIAEYEQEKKEQESRTRTRIKNLKFKYAMALQKHIKFIERKAKK